MGTVDRILYINNKAAAQQYLTIQGSHTRFPSGSDYAIETSSGGYEFAILNDDALSVLYPNENAHPTRCYFQTNLMSQTYASSNMRFYCGDTQVYFAGTYGYGEITVTSGWKTYAEVLASNKLTGFKLGVSSDATSFFRNIQIRMTFTTYSASATSGTGIASATVSTATPYEGDNVQFIAIPQSGYVFSGWYSGSTLVSQAQTYNTTVTGNISLEARATASNLKVRCTYKGNTTLVKTYQAGVSQANGVYKGQTVMTLTNGTVKTIAYDPTKCYFEDDLHFSDAKLNLKGKLIDSDITISGSYS